jgi:hypothetical protein
MECVISYFFFAMYSTLLIYPALNFGQPDIPTILISTLPAGWRQLPIVLTCCALEMLIFAVAITWLYFFVFMVLSFVMTFVQGVNSRLQISR